MSAQPEEERGPEPGLALERTSLAWGRSALSVAAIAGSIVKSALQTGRTAVGLVAGGVLLGLAFGVWAYGVRRYANRRADDPAQRGAQRLALRLICAVSLVSAILAFAMVVLS